LFRRAQMTQSMPRAILAQKRSGASREFDPSTES
jgi:hypothetical protein